MVVKIASIDLWWLNMDMCYIRTATHRCILLLRKTRSTLLLHSWSTAPNQMLSLKWDFHQILHTV